MRPYLPYVVLGALVVGLFFLLSSGTNAKVNPDKEGNYTLKMNKVYLFGGLIALITFVGINIMLFQTMTFNSINEEHIIFLVDLLILPLAIYAVMSYYRHKITFNSDELTVFKTNGQSYTMDWSDLEDVTYNAFSAKIFVSTKKHGKIGINQYLIGFKSFIEMLDSRTEIQNVSLLKSRLRMD
ncbi:hypothetical protein SAMN05216474_0981 [Lishizhenia tianjinensis]|uniref:Uncharacterized protein n=1 Tax=Lishizhenia tianjinensis TaxID=477690 RepID=A0A1I6YKW4_9FLAO|nr:hypothetical protein [Lishizhenia tianjinensis]SFT51100.1 hypothetical protein SAMN05216474_0981 [Lishizhenia tianjinensis]